ncbi:MAG: TetR/AcrR family transcriptional regulator [Actinomycetota bacterium]
MGRPARYSTDQILDAALAVAAREGADDVTVTAVAQELHAPSGSIYYRFRSRDLLLATLWLRTVEAFQDGYLDALALPDPAEAARAAAGHVVRWVRGHPAEAKLLMLYRREDLVEGPWPDEVRDRARTLNDRAAAGLRDLRSRLGRVSEGRFRFALDVPYASVRRFITEDVDPPPEVERLVAEAVGAILHL